MQLFDDKENKAIADVATLAKTDKWLLNSRNELLIKREDRSFGSVIDIYEFNPNDTFTLKNSLKIGQIKHAKINYISSYPCGLINIRYDVLPYEEPRGEFVDLVEISLTGPSRTRNIRVPRAEFERNYSSAAQMCGDAFWSLDKNVQVPIEDVSFHQLVYIALPAEEGIVYYSRKLSKMMLWEKETEKLLELNDINLKSCDDLIYLPERKKYLVASEGSLLFLDFKMKSLSKDVGFMDKFFNKSKESKEDRSQEIKCHDEQSIAKPKF